MIILDKIGHIPRCVSINDIKELELRQAINIVAAKIKQPNCPVFPFLFEDIGKVGLMIELGLGDFKLIDGVENYER